MPKDKLLANNRFDERFHRNCRTWQPNCYAQFANPNQSIDANFQNKWSDFVPDISR
jgi:hypothetical protein